MFCNNYITSVPIFQGAQGKYYLCDGYKYHLCYPMDWAASHSFGCGPKDCKNCADYGSIKGVFVGYCSNCLTTYLDKGLWRGVLVSPGLDINDFKNETIWQQYPYMSGVKKSEIGDEAVISEHNGIAEEVK